MMEAFCGTWNQVDCSNFDGMCEILDVKSHLKEEVKKPMKMVISQDGDKIGVDIINSIKKHQHCVKPGEVYDENTIYGRCAKSILRMEGDKLVKKQEWDGKEMRIEKEIKDGKMVVTLTCEGVAAVCTFEKA